MIFIIVNFNSSPRNEGFALDIFQFYKMPCFYLDGNPVPDVDGVRKFQIMSRKVVDEKPMEFGYINCSIE